MDPTTDNAVWAHFVGLVQAAYVNAPGANVPPVVTVGPPPAPEDWTPHGTIRHDHPVGSLEWAQAELNAIGLARPLLQVDGMNGPATARAVAAFQQAHGLYVDGDYGPATMAMLEKVSAAITAGP